MQPFFPLLWRLVLMGLMAGPCAWPAADPAGRPRARDLGIPFEGVPGPWNAITDVAGVEVGQATLIAGSGKLEVGRGPVRTGVTALFPLGRERAAEGVPAGCFVLNGNGEMTGLAWIRESGLLEGPVVFTNTGSVGVARDAVLAWGSRRFPQSRASFLLPAVGETYDGFLNDIYGFHVSPDDVFRALEAAAGGPVAEGNVGGGTGMICYQFKGGIGTASRRLPADAGGYTVGVLVQANQGRRHELTVAGVPVGRAIPDLLPQLGPRLPDEDGSILVALATDAPLLPVQLDRLARRAALGLARTGATSNQSSGDFVIAFSTVQPRENAAGVESWSGVTLDRLDPIFAAAVWAVEEAIINALVAAETMTGIDGHTVFALPHERLREIFSRTPGRQ